MSAPPSPEPQPSFRTVGANEVKLFGLSAKERSRRFAGNAGLPPDRSGVGPVILANLDYALDPVWLAHLRDLPGTVVTLAGKPVLAHALSAASADAIASSMAGTAAFELPPGHRELRAEAAAGVHSAVLRKREAPFVMRLTPDTADAAERASYDGAYKGVTDLLTLYLWRRPAFYLTRWAAIVGLAPNFITAIGALLCVLAFYLFWTGQYWPGIAAGFVFMVLDTVDGKLARCTGTSSRWGNIFDHGIDLVHPPFWWWAWGVGLGAYGRPMSAAALWPTLAVILVGYGFQRLIEGIFIRRFSFHIHVWQRMDSRFRLVTARRNPNMVILVAAMLFARPDIGLIAVAVWTAASLLFHAVRLVQALVGVRQIDSWLG